MVILKCFLFIIGMMSIVTIGMLGIHFCMWLPFFFNLKEGDKIRDWGESFGAVNDYDVMSVTGKGFKKQVYIRNDFNYEVIHLSIKDFYLASNFTKLK